MAKAADKKSTIGFWASTSEKHSIIEDVQGVVAGSMLAALGVTLLSAAHLLIVGTSGLGFLSRTSAVYGRGVVLGGRLIIDEKQHHCHSRPVCVR